jgi:hypothetical protein
LALEVCFMYLSNIPCSVYLGAHGFQTQLAGHRPYPPLLRFLGYTLQVILLSYMKHTLNAKHEVRMTYR